MTKSNSQHRPDLCRCTMEKDELVKDVVYIYIPRAITLGLGRLTRQLLHSFDNSIIFVYSYYIDDKLYLNSKSIEFLVTEVVWLP